MEQLETLISSAREHLEKKLAWLAPILNENLYILSEDCPYPVGVDSRGRVYFNIGALNQIVQSQAKLNRQVKSVAYLWYHGVVHLLFDHAGCANKISADPKLWNLCADWEVADSVPNSLIHSNCWQELQVPSLETFGIKPTADLSAEALYKQISQNQQSLPLHRDEGSGVHGRTCAWEHSGGRYLEARSLRDIQIEVALLLSKHLSSVPSRWSRWRDSILHDLDRRLIYKGRDWACKQVPWFAPALRAATLVFNNLTFHAAIDKHGRIYINPNKVIELVSDSRGELDDRINKTVRQVAFLFYHEIAHWIREHWIRFERSGTSNLQRWNVATDLEINDDIPDGLEPIQGILTPRNTNLPEGRTAEWYLRHCSESIDVHVSDEGSGVHGQKRAWEIPPDAPNHPAIRDFERATIQRRVAHELEEYKKSRGTVPAGWQRWAQEILQPKVSWREKLKKAVRGAITQGYGERLDYSMNRPNRRSAIYQPFYLPSLRGKYDPYIYCVIDTSGSINQNKLKHALGEVKGVLEQMQVPVRVVPCDAVPYDTVEVFTKSDLLKLAQSLRGGGGTDMVAALEHLKTARPKPDVVIVLTDGYTPYPEERTKEFTVIWGLWSHSRETPPKPPIPPWREEDVVLIPVED